MSISFVRRLGAPVVLLAVLAVVAGCAPQRAPGDGGAKAKVTAPPPNPDYVREAEHFAQLQAAGLRGDYPAFAKLLKSGADTTLAANLQRSFGGRPFDVYTREAKSDQSSYKRFLELRNASGRLYLYLRMDRVPGGWEMGSYEVARTPAAVRAKL